MRFVPIKTDDQLNLQSLHRVRERWVMRRTAVVNQIRGLLLERGITLRKGRCHLDAALPGILEDATTRLSGAVRLLLAQLKLELDQLAIRPEEADALIQKTAQENEVCRRLDAIPGIGPVTATALIAAIGNGAAFRKGREFAAWVGLVPREHSTGGKQTLLGISKRGNSYLRRLFVQGARAVLQFREKQSSCLSAWLAHLTSRPHYNVTVPVYRKYVTGGSCRRSTKNRLTRLHRAAYSSDREDRSRTDGVIGRAGVEGPVVGQVR
jgi:transposase